MATARLIIEDKDTDTGEVSIRTEIDNSMVEDGQMTAAEVMMKVVVAEVNSPAFQSKVWATVENMIAGVKGGTVDLINADKRPETEEEALGKV